MFHDDLPLSNCSKSPDVFQFRGQFWRTWYFSLAGLDERLCGRKKIHDILNTYILWLYRTGQIPKTQTCVIHLVVKSPIIWHTKRVDNAGVLVEDLIQTNELVSVHLFSLGSLSRYPVSTNPLQDSVIVQWVSFQTRILVLIENLLTDTL